MSQSTAALAGSLIGNLIIFTFVFAFFYLVGFRKFKYSWSQKFFGWVIALALYVLSSILIPKRELMQETPVYYFLSWIMPALLIVGSLWIVKYIKPRKMNVEGDLENQ